MIVSKKLGFSFTLPMSLQFTAHDDRNLVT